MIEKLYFSYLHSLKLFLISAFISIFLIRILCFSLIRKIWETNDPSLQMTDPFTYEEWVKIPTNFSSQTLQ